MNLAAANALYEAERKGVRQITNFTFDNDGGMCALGVLVAAGQSSEVMHTPMRSCPLCGEAAWWMDYEGHVMIHMNDSHRLTFAEIARKLGPDSA